MSTVIPQKPGCTNLSGYNEQEQQRFWWSDAGICKCNELAYNQEPGICDIVCPNLKVDYYTCRCTNNLKVGKRCDEDVCKSIGGAIYCIKRGGTVPETCSQRVSQDKLNILPYCPCLHGGRLGKENPDSSFALNCECQENYYGVFCEKQSRSSTGVNWSVILPVLGIFALAIGIVVFMYWWRKKKMRENTARFQSQIPIPGSTIPGPTAPLVEQGGPSMPLYDRPPPYPASIPPGSSGQPVPPGQFSINTTYTFTPHDPNQPVNTSGKDGNG